MWLWLEEEFKKKTSHLSQGCQYDLKEEGQNHGRQNSPWVFFHMALSSGSLTSLRSSGLGEICHGQKYGFRYTDLVPISAFLCGYLNYRAMQRIVQTVTGSLGLDPKLWQKWCLIPSFSEHLILLCPLTNRSYPPARFLVSPLISAGFGIPLQLLSLLKQDFLHKLLGKL